MGYVQEKSVSISSLSPGYVAYLLPVQNAGANAFGHYVVLFPSPDPFSTKVQLIHRGESEPGALGIRTNAFHLTCSPPNSSSYYALFMLTQDVCCTSSLSFVLLVVHRLAHCVFTQ
jgi:hypothetical protein